jgi:peptidyl-prolyl cis-trans isomerase B (cyclophilin B)
MISCDALHCSVGVAGFAAVSVLGASAFGQLTPDRLYYGVDRTIPMTVAVPESVDGEVMIKLLSAPDASVLAEAAAAEGGVDLAALFPTLWTDKVDEVRYAQLAVGGRLIGPSVVLQPLTSPDTATIVDPQSLQPVANPRAGRVLFDSQRMERMHEAGFAPSPDRAVTYSGLRAWVDRHVILETSEGEIEIAMRPDAAPNTCWNFIVLAEGGFYTGIEVHRIVAALPNGAPFVIQAGDPTGSGSGGPGYFVDLENSDLQHDYGVVSMARSGNPNSNGSQFFICLSREGTSFLDGNYTAFAEVISGVPAIEAIRSVETGEGDRPVEPPLIVSARTVPAPARGEGPGRVSAPSAEGER